MDIETRQLILDAAEYAVKKYRVEIGKEKPDISYREACKRYSKANVDSWRSAGLIHPRKGEGRNSKIRIDILEIDCVSKSCK